MQVIQFWSRGDQEYQYLSNFYHAPFTVHGQNYPSVEHFYFCEMFPHAKEEILAKRTAREVKLLSPSLGSRPTDWDDEQGRGEKVMCIALKAKFSQNPELRQRLLDTGDAILVHYAPWDGYWGTGRNGDGKNRHGYLLMKLRQHFQKGQ